MFHNLLIILNLEQRLIDQFTLDIPDEIKSDFIWELLQLIARIGVNGRLYGDDVPVNPNYNPSSDDPQPGEFDTTYDGLISESTSILCGQFVTEDYDEVAAFDEMMHINEIIFETLADFLEVALKNETNVDMAMPLIGIPQHPLRWVVDPFSSMMTIRLY